MKAVNQAPDNRSSIVIQYHLRVSFRMRFRFRTTICRRYPRIVKILCSRLFLRTHRRQGIYNIPVKF